MALLGRFALVSMVIMLLTGAEKKEAVPLMSWVEDTLLAEIKNDALLGAPWFAGHVLKTDEQYFRSYFKEQVQVNGLVLNNVDVRIAQAAPRRYLVMFDLPRQPCVPLDQVIATDGNGEHRPPSPHDLRQIASYAVRRGIAEVVFGYEARAAQPCVTGMAIQYFEK